MPASLLDSTAEKRARVLLLSIKPELSSAIIDALRDRADIVDLLRGSEYPNTADILSHNPTVCFIDVGETENALPLIQELANSDIPVAALHINNDSNLILRSFRCGASEFLCPPITPADVLDALERLLRKSLPGSAAAQRGKIWAIVPAKPGYGATTISCNLAVRFRQAIKRPVLLGDFDPVLGSVSFALKLKSAFSFMDVMSRGFDIDKDSWKKIVVQFEGIDVLLGPEVPRFDTPAPDIVPRFVEFTRANYAAAVFDCPGPMTDWHLSIARAADEVLLITTNELAAVHACLRAMQLLERAGTERTRFRLIVNRYERDNGLIREAIETALKLDVFATLPNDYGPVQKSVLDGKTVPSACKLGEAFDDVSQRLMGLSRAQKKRWTPSLSSLFSRKSA
jgi:Flp pilus assembly CpaE family ATPase